MQTSLKRRLTKVALALAVAGYCSIPTAMAAGENNLKSGQWTPVTETTGAINGTVPWITSNTAGDMVQDSDAKENHVVVTVDRHGRTSDSDPEGKKQLHVGDTITVSWTLGDKEGDVDNGTSGLNAATKGTIKWIHSKSQDGSDAEEISGATGTDSYTVTTADIDRYIGIKIQPISTTGTPDKGSEISLVDLSSDAGGGSDSDGLPTGPVVDDNLHVVIYKDGTSTNLLGTSTILTLNTTYKVLLWSDKNGNNTYDTGEDVTSDYHYRWRLVGNSAVHGTGVAGLINESHNDQSLVIPATNAAAKTDFDNTGTGGATLGDDGVQGFSLSIDYQRK